MDPRNSDPTDAWADDAVDPAAEELSALADGELAAADAARVARRVADDPAALDAVRDHQRLTTAARSAVRRGTPPPSAALVARLRALEVPPAAPRVRRPAALGWVVRGAVAAGLVVAGGVVGATLVARRPGTVATTGSAAAPLVPASVVAHASRIHAECSRLADGLHSAGYPADLGPLSDAVRRDLASPDPWPDLRPIGFRYRGAGPCDPTLSDTAHLLYVSTWPASRAAVSVFVQPYHGQYAMAAGRAYTVSTDASPFPMLAWRTDRVVYFLLADNPTIEAKAAAAIRTSPAATRPGG